MSLCPTCAAEFQGPNIYRVGFGGTWKKCPNGHYFRKPKPVRIPAAQARAKIRNEAYERAAVEAWKHYMDTCKKNGLNPAEHEKWLCAEYIRDLKEKE